MNPGASPALGLAVTGREHRDAILFLHGFMGSKFDWTEVTNELVHGLRCVAVDLPGHGDSVGLPDAAYTVEGAAKAIVLALDRLEIPHATLVGYSMGGRLALYLALRHPDRCAGLFLESASPGLKTAEELAARRAADDGTAGLLEHGDLEEFLRGWYRQPLFEPLARDEELLRRTIRSRLANDPKELARSLRGMGTGSQPPLWEDLRVLQTPALAVAGALDEKFVGISRLMADLSPNIRAAVVPGVGHNVHVEAPAAYLALLQGFQEDLRVP